MENIDLKQKCAKAAVKYIKNHMVVGLGGGKTIEHLITYIKEENLKVKIVTPSIRTKDLCISNELEVLHTTFVDKIDVAFDGCDEVDYNLNALKSGGGIHTKEKLIGAMAKEYILLVDEGKVKEKLIFKVPVVLEILEEAFKYVEKEVIKFGGKPVIRMSSSKDGFTISDNGNLLMDVFFHEVENIPKLNNQLRNIYGVIETSLFTNEVNKVIISSEDGIRELV